MKISELIEKLEKIKKDNGDIEVLCTCGEGCDEWIDYVKELIPTPKMDLFDDIGIDKKYKEEKYLVIRA